MSVTCLDSSELRRSIRGYDIIKSLRFSELYWFVLSLSSQSRCMALFLRSRMDLTVISFWSTLTKQCGFITDSGFFFCHITYKIKSFQFGRVRNSTYWHSASLFGFLVRLYILSVRVDFWWRMPCFSIGKLFCTMWNTTLCES